MPEEAILIGLSQLGAVFAGFIAIFMVFTQANGKFSPVDALRVRIIIYTSFLSVLAALIPIVLHGLDIAPAWLWRLATTIYLLLSGSINFDILRSQRALGKVETPDRTTRTFQLIGRILNLAMFIVGALILAGIGQGGLYIVMLFISLTTAGVTFVSFAMQRLFQ